MSNTADTADTPTQTLQVRLPTPIAERLDAFCDRYTVGKTHVVARALEIYLEEAEKRLTELP